MASRNPRTDDTTNLDPFIYREGIRPRTVG